MLNRHVVLLLSSIALLAGCQASVQATGRAQGQADASGYGQGSGNAGPGEAAGASCPAPAPGQATADRGPSPQLGGNHVMHPLPAGTYHGDLEVSGNHVTVCGAGQGQTIIEGALKLGGNHNSVTGITVRQHSQVGGNHNSVRGVQFLQGADIGGNHTAQ